MENEERRENRAIANDASPMENFKTTPQWSLVIMVCRTNACVQTKEIDGAMTYHLTWFVTSLLMTSLQVWPLDAEASVPDSIVQQIDRTKREQYIITMPIEPIPTSIQAYCGKCLMSQANKMGCNHCCPQVSGLISRRLETTYRHTYRHFGLGLAVYGLVKTRNHVFFVYSCFVVSDWLLEARTKWQIW